MKEIISQYGSAMIAIIVGVAVLMAFMKIPYAGKNGIAASAGNFIEESTTKVLQKEMITGVFDKYLKEYQFEVAYVGEQPLVAGQKVDIHTNFQATDGAGREVSMKVITILDAEGNVYHTHIQDGKEYLYLEQEGIYRIYLCAQEERGWDTVVAISFPVQRG